MLVAGAVFTSFVLEDSLPPPLKEYLKAEADRGIAAGDIVFLVGGIIFVLAALIASAGLFFLQKWARWLYLAATFVAYAAMLFSGPSVEHAVAGTVGDLTVLISGVILGMAFFTDVLEKQAAPQQTSRSGKVS